MNAIFDYCLNKFLPYLLLATVLFSCVPWDTWEPYAILSLAFFIDKFSFKTGYSVAYCEKRGIDPVDPEL